MPTRSDQRRQAVQSALRAVGGQGIHAVVAERVAVWQERCGWDAGDDYQDPSYLYFLATGFRDTDGTIMTPAGAEALIPERCLSCEPGDDG